MRNSTSSALGVALVALVSFGCSPTVHHARLDHASGIVQGAPVLVSGVRVGRVESLRVVESSVDVGFVFEGDHQVTLRADSCAMASAAEAGGALVIIPGEQAPLATEHVLPQCHLAADALEDVMGSFGEGLEEMMRAIQQQAAQAGAPLPQGTTPQGTTTQSAPPQAGATPALPAPPPFPSTFPAPPEPSPAAP